MNTDQWLDYTKEQARSSLEKGRCIHLLGTSVRKRQRQGGEEYTDSGGNVQTAPNFKKDCQSCKFLCSKNIFEEERKRIFNELWAQNTQDTWCFY